VVLVHTTAQDVPIYVAPGKKSTHDFRVLFMGPYRRLRTPKHVHLIVELYVKQAFNEGLTLKLRDHLLDIFARVQPITNFPPAIQIFDPSAVTPFLLLNDVGEFSVEFFLVVNELIFIQEKTNYPQGSETQRLYRDFTLKDRFSVIGGASWRGRRG
jgi:hypothetical protein